MKYVLRTVVFAFVICGVFSAADVEVKSVMEGESVTLNPDLTQIKEINQIRWLFQKKGSNTSENIQNVDILQGRWKTNDLTGSLTINNTRSKHSGLYRLQIDHIAGSENKHFTVTVNEVPSVIEAHKAEIKSLTVTEGEPLVLETDVTEFHGDELIVWRFGDEGKLLAKEDKETKSSPYYNTDERYKGRLKLNDQTGFLTLDEMKDTDAGYYTVRISSNKRTIYKKFAVNFTGFIISGSVVSPVAGGIIALLLVFAVVAGLGVLYYRHKISELQEHVDKTISGEVGDSITLPPETEMQVGDLIMWMFGPEDRLIAKGEMNAQGFCTQNGTEGNITLDQAGSLTITNSTTEHSGVYKLLVISVRETKHKRFRVAIHERKENVEVEMESMPLKINNHSV